MNKCLIHSYRLNNGERPKRKVKLIDFIVNHYHASLQPLKEVLWTGLRDWMSPWLPPEDDVRTKTTSLSDTSLTTSPVVVNRSAVYIDWVKIPPTTSLLTTSSVKIVPPEESPMVQEKT